MELALQTITVRGASDGVAVAEIARPEKLNAMNHAFFADLQRALQLIDEAPDVRACVLTGSGRAFSAGGDIADFDALTDAESHRRQVRMALEAFHAVEQAQTIVIAAVNGLAYGGGTELTLACDIALASTEATFAFKEVTVGLMPAFGVVRAPEVIGRSWSSWLALSGGELDAQQALRIGLIQQVAPAERLLDEAISLAEVVASRPPLAVRTAKQFINRHSAAGLNEAIEATAMLYSDPLCRKLIKAFVSRDAAVSKRTSKAG